MTIQRPKKTLKKPATKSRPAVSTSTSSLGKGEGRFKVTLRYGSPDAQTFLYPNENGAVMFACIHSREHGWTARVDDPGGKHVVTFYKREYDVTTQRKPSIFIQQQLDGLQTEVARARAERLAQPAPKKKLLKRNSA